MIIVYTELLEKELVVVWHQAELAHHAVHLQFPYLSCIKMKTSIFLLDNKAKVHAAKQMAKIKLIV